MRNKTKTIKTEKYNIIKYIFLLPNEKGTIKKYFITELISPKIFSFFHSISNYIF
jgi:hypothetical protein